MKVLITGSSGHLGEALIRTLRGLGHEARGLDILTSPFTSHVGSIADRSTVRSAVAGVRTVFHTATLHKPHVATHERQAFVDTNISGTLNLLEEAAKAGVGSFIFTSTTSIFGDALIPPAGSPAAWITEDVSPVPKNIYGVTKMAAEDLCQLFYRNEGLSCIVLRTSRFFPEVDDSRHARESYSDENLKVNEFLCRRVDIEDVVGAHLLAAEKAASLGFRRLIISATTPFMRDDLADLRRDAMGVVRRRVPGYEERFEHLGWRMFPSIDRVYDNARARGDLGWAPKHDFSSLVARLVAGQDTRSGLARLVGSKGYHAGKSPEDLYPVE